MPSLPVIRIRGTPYQRGFQHGRACGDLIRRYPDVLSEALQLEATWRALDVNRPIPNRDDLINRAIAFIPSLKTFAPQLLEEVRGIADGARLPFAEVLLANVRAEVMGIATTEALCTAFAVGRSATARGDILSGQNLDQHPLNRELMIMLHVEPDNGPAILMCSFAGLVGYPGINGRGLSFFQNALSTKTWLPSAMPHYFLKRVLLEQSTIAECLSVLERAKVCSSANYVLTDRNGALCDIELTPDGLARIDPAKDVIVHTNHFRSPRLARFDALLPTIPDSAERAPRMEALLAKRRGKIDIDYLKAVLADHEHPQTGICRHQMQVETIASIIAEPEQGRLHVAAGHPCRTEFVTYSL
jgi:isopenicillin-N N-acyltransferase-like protein